MTADLLRPRVPGVLPPPSPPQLLSGRCPALDFLSRRRPSSQVSSSASCPLSSAGLLPSGTERLAALQLPPDSVDLAMLSSVIFAPPVSDFSCRNICSNSEIFFDASQSAVPNYLGPLLLVAMTTHVGHWVRSGQVSSEKAHRFRNVLFEATLLSLAGANFHIFP